MKVAVLLRGPFSTDMRDMLEEQMGSECIGIRGDGFYAVHYWHMVDGELELAMFSKETYLVTVSRVGKL